MEMVDKAAVLAEIERQLHYVNSWLESNKGVDGRKSNIYFRMLGNRSVLESIKDFINNLETKAVDLGNSMVCKVDWYDGFLLDYTQEQQDELLEKIGADVGDKIRIILIKE